MLKIFILFKKELAHYFNSPVAYIFIAVFLVATNWLFWSNFFLISQANMRSFFALLPWIFLFLAPAVSMRVWSEEKKTGTFEVLLTLPVSDWHVVGAKFLAALAFLAFNLVLTLSVPFSIARLGSLDWGPVIGGYIGALFLGGSYLALGIFISSLTRNQIIAFVLGAAACFGFFIVGTEFVSEGLPQFLRPITNFIGLGNHFNTVSKGVIDSKDIFYYSSFIFLFLWLNARVIEKR